MTQEANVKLKIDSKEAHEEIQRLEKQAEKLRNDFNECFRKGDTAGLKKATEELNRTNKQIANLRTNAQNIDAALKRLDQASPKELKQTLKLINTELNSGRVPRGSKQWQEYCEQVKKVKRELAAVQGEMREQEGLLSRLKNKFNDWGASAAAAIGAFAGVVMSGKAAVQAYADMEAEEANVRKFTGMTAEEVEKLNEAFKKMDTRTSREELNQLAQEAGRLGKSSHEDVLGFVTAANQINVALDDLGEGATLQLSKLTQIFGDEQRLGTEKALLSVGSVINELSQNCAASAPYLAEFASRLGGVGAQAGMTVQQIMGIAAVLDAKGQKVEASATAISQVLTRMYQDPSKYAKAAGLEVKSFTELVRKDANEALMVLSETLNAKGGLKETAPIFKDMGENGARAVAALATLAENIKEVRSQQAVANKAFEEATSVTNEYNVQNNTVQAQLDKAKKKFNELAVDLGKKLLPVMKYAISGSSMLMRVIAKVVDFVIKFHRPLIALTLAIVAYNVVAKAAAIQTNLVSAAHKVAAIASSTWRAAMLLCNAALNTMRGNATRAAAAIRIFNASIKANPIGLVIGAITALIGLMNSLVARYNDNIIATEKARKEQEEFRKSCRDLEAETASNAKAEKSRLDMLYEAATNENKSRKERIDAAKELQKLFPDYFSNMQAETIMAGKAKEQYEKLAESIIMVAEAKAAAAKIEENEGKIIELKQQLHKQEEDARKARENIDRAQKAMEADNNKKSSSSSTVVGAFAAAGMAEGGGSFTTSGDSYQTNSNNLKKAKDELKGINDEIGKLNSQLDELNDAQKFLKDNYGDKIVNLQSQDADTDTNIPDTGKVETEKERKEREKRERKAAAEARKAEAKAKKELKDQLDQQKAIRDKDLASNMADYASGQKSYKEFIERKNEIDQEYIDNRKKVYEGANQTESDDYAKLLKEEEELKAKQAERLRKVSAREVENRHNEKLNELSEDYFNPNSAMFQNQKAYNQALLDEDLRYLEEKRDLYAAGSDEWERLNAEINDRLAKDQLDKKKELAEALLAVSGKYQKLDREQRMQAEIETLEQLHSLGLISEEAYQKALARIKGKYREEEEDEHKINRQKEIDEIRKTYAETKDILSMSSDVFAKAFSELLDQYNILKYDLAAGNKEFFTDIMNMCQTATELMGAALSQYSAYANAERDLELARIEKRYDKEIEAAGKNTKKKEQLEKQKEEAIAKTKKKYNDRAMAMEIAQAVAQSAVNAILGYKAGLEMPAPANTFMPAVLAGLAVAQGAMQIAIIKKQHEAQAAGYYEGGFTGGSNYRREAGVVHEGEFIANHHAVNNPRLSRMFALLDFAQRNNTVGSLTAEDVSFALGQGRGVSARGAVSSSTAAPTVINKQINVAALDRLNALLEKGIEAHTIMDGEQGLYRKLKKFEQLINNPKR